MDVNFMQLEGWTNLDAFVEEWWNSESHNATYLQSEGGIYMMPYGIYVMGSGEIDKKFTGTSRCHTFIRRDFELKGTIDGGGYLRLNEDRGSCRHGNNSRDFPGRIDRDAVVDSVMRELLSG